MRRRRSPNMKVPGTPLQRENRAAQSRANSYVTESTLAETNPRRPRMSRALRRPFPALSFRVYYHWPAGLAYAVGLPWQAGRREAA